MPANQSRRLTGLAQITSGAHHSSVAEADRRGEERCEGGPGLRASLIEGGVAWPAFVADLSAIGAALLLARPFEPGATAVCVIRDRAGHVAHLLEARVAHATPLSSGWLVGCVFATPLAPEQLHALQQ
jgi:hypothetical protein